MKDRKIFSTYKPMKGKTKPERIVKSSKQEISKRIQEVPMNIYVVTTLSMIGLGVLTFLAHRINSRVAQQPILIEERKIIYKRRP